MTIATEQVVADASARVLREGYGDGAWHGPDLKAALADVTSEQAFSRPAKGRHNIAEIALHHAFYVRSVRSKISGVDAGPFVVEGEDWFDASKPEPLSWKKIAATVQQEHEQLVSSLADVQSGKLRSPLTTAERFDLALGITCHAVYHAGQIQLIKKILGG
jgi:hypothetical protein